MDISARSFIPALLVGGLVILAGCGGFGGAEATPTPDFSATPAFEQIVADARILPEHSVDLSFRVSGTVAEIMVEEGDQVSEGQMLARLNSADFDLQVEEAQAALARARAAYAQIEAGATPEEIAVAESNIAQAEANLRQVEGGVTSADIAAARARLNQAQAALARLQSGPKQTQIDSAQAALDQAHVHLDRQHDALSAAKVNAELALEQAANTLRDAQDSYSQVYWENRALEDQLAKFGDELPQENKDAEAAALRAVQSAEAALEQARVALEDARQAEVSGIASAEAQVRDAQARLDQLLAGADADAIAAAQAQVRQAQADLQRLTGEQRVGQVEAAEASVDSAQAQRDQVAAGPRAADLEAAQAQIWQAEVVLKQAELARDRATLYAPFDGTVAQINLTANELPDPTLPAVVIADLSGWKLETRDLTELDVVSVRVGDTVLMTFDALPDLELQGVVREVKIVGESYQGDVSYTVVIEPREWDARLRWNMTATIAITPAESASAERQ